MVPAQSNNKLAVELFSGPRSELFPLFAQADDSSTAINAYIELGEVYIAQMDRQIIGHVQWIPNGTEWEIKSIAVVSDFQGKGVGTALIRTVLEKADAAGVSRIVVATATADINTLRFYQRLGFRMDRIERDVFTAENGYPNLEADGIPVRDRVWFSIRLGSEYYGTCP